jgi:hypothetical protein
MGAPTRTTLLFHFRLARSDQRKISMLTKIFPFLDPVHITRELSERLQALAKDCVILEHDVTFVSARLHNAPILDSYVPVLTPLGLHLVGQVTQHPLLGSRKIVTSQVWFADPEGHWARTLSRFYRLGRPADPDDRDHILASSPFTFDGCDEDGRSGDVN